jgi:CrcB protein
MIWAIALGGAAGTVARYLLTLAMQRTSADFPFGTLLINVVGSFLIGFLARVLSVPGDSPVLRAALTVGFCGGFTTFSTFSAEFVNMVQQGRIGRAMLYVVVSVSVGVTATMLGLALGSRLIATRG